jgi:hypothetical protein
MVIIAGIIGVAFWVAGKQAGFSSRAAAVIAGYASLAWAVWRYDRTQASWDFVRHPENLGAYLSATARLDAVMRQAEPRRDPSAPPVVAPKSPETPQRAAEPAPRSVRPLMLLDRRGHAQIIDTNDNTDVLSLGIRDISDPDFRKTLGLVNDPDVLLHTASRKRTYVIYAEYEEFVRDSGGEIMFRNSKMRLPGASDVAFYNPSNGHFDVTPYAWLVNVLGMDRDRARALYAKHMGHPPSDP